MSPRLLLLVLALVPTVADAQVPVELGPALRWRNVGPFRGGRTRAVCGVASQPNVFYLAPVNGGVFKTTDAGRTWQPIFDDQPSASIGALAVAPSDPNVIYAGSGEGLHRPDLSVGDGLYKSLDAGKTWTHLGLRDGQQIAQIAVDPKNPDRLFVAVAGHPYGPNEERGVFRSLNGGKTLEKILYQDENTGAADVLIDPLHPEIIYAALWESREGPWENGAWSGTNGGIHKSTDGGTSWTRLTQGLPEGIAQANLALAPSSPQTLCAAVRTARSSDLFRSDDGGASWQKATEDPRPAAGIGGGDLPVVRFDPTDPQIVYSASVVCWKSTDGGRTWLAWRGAPGGDDYQNVWINPNHPEIVLLGSDQGAVITVNGGASWSSWYNQPTAQLYHVSADNAFPYRLYSGQQESGSVGIASRGNDGAITFRDWHPVAAEEYGYVVADPLDPDIVYGGKLSRYDRRTGQAQSILPVPLPSPDFRMIRTQPIVFSPVDPHLLFFAGNTLWQTRDRGQNWQQISPDLSRPTYEVPASVGKYRAEAAVEGKRRGVIYTVAPSPLEVGRIWAGTDDGLIHLTTNGGKQWTNVTPPVLTPWQKVSLIEAGHFDAKVAFAAVNTLRLDDLRPHIYRTDDAGRTWQEIVRGIPASETVNVVREDPRRRGLLFASTERGVHVSFDNGEHWQPLRLNLPATSVRDLIIKDDDLAIATHGRGFWILDNFSPLRQLASVPTATTLFPPQVALRVRWSMNTDTPLPPDEPAGENPPDGAMIDYFLPEDASGPVTLEIQDAKGGLIRRYASTDPLPVLDESKLRIPSYWVRPPQPLRAVKGLHRFLWDLHLAPQPGADAEYPMTAIYRNTAPAATSPWVPPGAYTVVLTVNGQSLRQPLAVKMDPRVKATPADLARQFELSRQLSELRAQLSPVGRQYEALVEKLPEEQKRAASSAAEPLLATLAQKLEALAPPTRGRRSSPHSLHLLNQVGQLFEMIQDVDAAPTPFVQKLAVETLAAAPSVLARWRAIVADDLTALNAQLQKSNLPALELPAEK